MVGLVRGEAEYRPGVLDTEHVYVRLVGWLTRLRRSDFTPATQRDLFSLTGVNDLRPHLREIHQRLTGIDLGESVELRTMSRGQVLRGDALTLDRTNPAQLILTRHRGYHARRLAGRLTVFGLLLTLLAACGSLEWQDPNAAVIVLSLLATGIGVMLLLALPRLWQDLRISMRGEVLVLDHERRSVAKRRRLAVRLETVTAVDLHTRTYVFEGGWTLAHPTAQGEILWLPANPTHLHRLSLSLEDRQEVLIDAGEDLRQCLIFAYACVDFLEVPLLRHFEQIVVDNSDNSD